MVSIHIVPIVVCLIIKVISSTFRFKREAVRIICFRGSGKPVVQDKTTPHAKPYISLIYTRLA